MIHAIANNLEPVNLADDSPLLQYINHARGLSFNDRGLALVQNDGIKRAHRNYSGQGDTAAINESGTSNHHFICFVPVGFFG